ncbi:MAG TPA: methionine adenosyltransferase [Planctomycetota bacterium]|nr:methionine adenosyltransferase [Planctomycetota bacterium]
MSGRRHLFTSEAVTMGHPDKVADQISDAIVDAYIAGDPASRVACETLVTTGLVVIAGEITSKTIVDLAAVARQTIAEIGYTDPKIGFDANSCGVVTSVHRQSPDIAQGVDETSSHEQGAGDQGMMFGFACRETRELMPAPICYAHRLVHGLTRLRTRKILPYIRPDGKTQVTVEYENNKPVRIHTVVVSTQHHEKATQRRIKADFVKLLIPKTFPKGMVDKDTIIHVNPTGRFVMGGPHGDTGLTGRKIIVDTYGGSGSHGGGAFSGKDPSKVDRSASYAARHIAKNIVAAGLADRCEVQLSYAIGIARPISINVDTEGTGRIADEKLEALIAEHWDLRPRAIIDYYKLRRPIFKHTARYGHLGHSNYDIYTWERTEKAAALRKAAGL